MSEKTEEATPRKLRKAREDGDSPVSGALVQGVGFLVAVAVAPAALSATAARCGELIVRAIQSPLQRVSAVDIARDVTTLTLPMVGAAAIAAVSVGLVQSGGVVAFKKLAPDLNRANPISGLKNIFSAQRLISVARSLVAALVVGYLAVRLLIDHAPDLSYAAGSGASAAVVAGDLATRLLWIAALVGLGLAAVDLLIVHWSWRKRHRMAKDEIKREFKESEGDPELQAARKRAHQEMLEGATLHAVKNASVVVVNPTHLAVALHYQDDDEDSGAPTVVAQGRGELARRMMDAARAYSVPIIRDVPVARALSELEVGDEIPENLYEAVAEILREAWSESESTPQ